MGQAAKQVVVSFQSEGRRGHRTAEGVKSFALGSSNKPAQIGVLACMARPLRIEFQNAWYHVMNRGAGRRNTFLTNYHRELFLKILGEATELLKMGPRVSNVLN